MLYSLTMRFACVPLPAPGGPSKTILIDLSLNIDAGAIFQPSRFRGFVLKFFCSDLSLQKSGLQRHPIGLLGVVEQAEMLGNGIGGQTVQIGSRQTHERFRLGARHGDL